MKGTTEIEVSLKKVGRHTTAPTVEITLGKAKRFIKKEKIEVVEGEAYAVYDCGHVFNIKDDPRIQTYYPNEGEKGLSVRSCPVCVTEKLMTKYKLCGCGAEHASKRVQPSKCCDRCAAGRRAQRPVKHALYLRNGHTSDPSRCYCVHRDECIMTYIEYDAIPCKNCRRFKVKQGGHDPIGTDTVRIN